MKKVKKIFFLCVAALLLITGIRLLNPLEVRADAPYKTYTIDGYGNVTETQTA